MDLGFDFVYEGARTEVHGLLMQALQEFPLTSGVQGISYLQGQCKLVSFSNSPNWLNQAVQQGLEAYQVLSPHSPLSTVSYSPQPGEQFLLRGTSFGHELWLLKQNQPKQLLDSVVPPRAA